jgi:SM-20-related protein
MQSTLESVTFFDGNCEDSLFERIAQDIEKQGFSINHHALPAELTRSLVHHLHNTKVPFDNAGIGRAANYQQNERIRSDEICWITGDSLAGRHWLKWAAALQTHLNRRLFLGLFSFESHFAHYLPGAFYRRHLDAFKGEANRILSLVVYLNPDWESDQGGELVLYCRADDAQGTRILPSWATVVVFLSEDFPHEVLPAVRDRYSIAGWFRLNTSIFNRVDPPV